MASPDALTAQSSWLVKEVNHHVADSPTWIATGAIVSLDLAAIGRLFGGALDIVACITSLYAIPAIVFVWLIASWRGS